MPDCCLIDGCKTRLHFPGTKGGAAPLLPLCFPSSCLSRVMEEAGCHIPLGGSFCMVSLTQCWPPLGATHFGRQRVVCMKGYTFQVLLACNIIADLQCLFSSLALTLLAKHSKTTSPRMTRAAYCILQHLSKFNTCITSDSFCCKDLCSLFVPFKTCQSFVSV